MKNTLLNLVLLGGTGVGKSASGNTILGRDAFESRQSFTAVTEALAKKSGTVDGLSVAVYDTPGLSSSGQSEEKIYQMINENLPQKCVFLLVIKTDRFTAKERRTVEKIEKVLGQKRLKKTWILFTRGDELEDENTLIKEFFNDSKALKTLIQKYDQRYHVFNNTKKGDNKQVQLLLRKIQDSMVSEVRIVLLGKSVSESSRVGNLILGRSAFDSEAPPDVVERVGGRLKDRHVTLINSPQLLQTNISDDQITQTVRECVSLSDPGPHVFIITLQYRDFTLEDMRRVRRVLNRFSEEAMKHTIIITTDEETHISTSVNANEFIQQLSAECGGGLLQLDKEIQSQFSGLLDGLEKIQRENNEQFLTCEL